MPELGVRLVIAGANVTVKFVALLDTPDAVTSTFPEVAAVGTGAMIEELDHKVGVACVPLNVRVFDPCVVPKFVPRIVTDVVTGPLPGHNPAIYGDDDPPEPLTSAVPTE